MQTRTIDEIINAKRNAGKPVIALIQVLDTLYNQSTQQFNYALLNRLKAHGIRQLYLLCDLAESFEQDLQSIKHKKGMALDDIVRECQAQHFKVLGVLSAIDLDEEAAPSDGYALQYLPLLEEYRKNPGPELKNFMGHSGSLNAVNLIGEETAAQCNYTTISGLIYLKLRQTIQHGVSAILYIDSNDKNLIGALSLDVAFSLKTKQPELLTIASVTPFTEANTFDHISAELEIAKITAANQLIPADLRLLQRDQLYFLLEHVAKINPSLNYISTREYPAPKLLMAAKKIMKDKTLTPLAQVQRLEKCVEESFAQCVASHQTSYTGLLFNQKSVLEKLNSSPDHYHAERLIGLILRQFYRRRKRLDETFVWLEQVNIPKNAQYQVFDDLPLSVPMLDVKKIEPYEREATLSLKP